MQAQDTQSNFDEEEAENHQPPQSNKDVDFLFAGA